MDVNTANQSTTEEQMMDILLALDKEKKTISAVKGVDENGELQTVPPENSDLLKFDRNGDFFSNFFSNMMNQLKNPTRFSFFKIPKIELPKIIPDISIMYSDYGSINPIRNDNVIMANGWRPRIDVPLETEIFYYRRRKVPKGYAVTYSLVAVDATRDRRFPSEIKNWGINQIIIAADGASPGSSPSFWISVRMNIYIEQQLRRLSLR